MRDRVRIRRVRPGDWRRVRALRLRALRMDPLAFGSTYRRERAYPEELWRERVARGATSLREATWLAQGPDGSCIGLVTLRALERPAGIFGMWLTPGCRGRGIGGRLLDRALAWLAQRDARAPVELEVNPRQRAAMGLYRSRGFRETGRSQPLGHTVGEVCQLLRREPPPEPA